MSVTLDKDSDFREYVCHYLVTPFQVETAGVQARGLGEAMHHFNMEMPEYSTQVVKWICPGGIRFLGHDSRV